MDAIYTWGTGDDFKHFIPRLFELLAQGLGPENDFVHPAEIFTKLKYESWCSAPWRTWPEQERVAISNYFRVVWNAVLDSNPEELLHDGVHGWIEALAQAEQDLSGYLDHWLDAPSVNAHRNLALMITEQGLPNAGKPSGGYWAGHREQRQQLNEWLRRGEVRQRLTNALDRWNAEEFADEFIDAAVLLPSFSD